jgi:5,5'-dehydrodivanillate O-demethylase
MPTCTRVIVPPMAGYDGVGGWKELYLNFTPIDDENQQWFPINLVKVTGEAAERYMEKHHEYLGKTGAAEPVPSVAQKIIDGMLRLQDVQHPDLVRVQDAAVQVGQGVIEDRSNERLGRSDTGIILWRKILSRELRALADGRPLKQWQTPPADLIPTLGF